MSVALTLFGEDFEAPCAEGQEHRLADLAAALDERMRAAAAASGEADARRLMALVALALMDETQQSAAAALRARREVDRLREALAASETERAELVADTEARLGAAARRVAAVMARL